MTEQEPKPLAQEVAKIVAEEQDVRQRVSEAYARAVAEQYGRQGRVSELTEEAVAGAAKGAEQVEPPRQESVLREVLDGLRDGFVKAANATRLTIEEAGSRQRFFSEQDVQEATADLERAVSILVATIDVVARQATSEVADRLRGLKSHAERTVEAARPPIQAAVDAARRQPGQLAKETAGLGVKAGQQAAGELFRAVGKLMHTAGDEIDRLSQSVKGKSGKS